MGQHEDRRSRADPLVAAFQILTLHGRKALPGRRLHHCSGHQPESAIDLRSGGGFVRAGCRPQADRMAHILPPRDAALALAATVLRVLDQWQLVARWAESGAIVLWSPRLSELTDRMQRLRAILARELPHGVRTLLQSELYRLDTERVHETTRLIQSALDADPLLLISPLKISG